MNALPERTALPEPATVGIRALKQNASAVVARAAAGEAIVVTDRGRPVARLLPLERKSRIQEMIDAGQITMPTVPLQEALAHLPRIQLPEGSPSILETLDELREERL